MKQTMYTLVLFLLLVSGLMLAGCTTQPATQPTASDPGYSGALESTYENALDPIGQLALGTIHLEGSQNAVTEAQASGLLPLWQSLQGNELQGDAERYAVARRIEANMSETQIAAIAAMRLTQEDVTAWTQSQGGDTQTAVAPGGGQRPEGTPSGITEEQMATRGDKFEQQGDDAAAMIDSTNTRFLSNAVVALLSERSSVTIAQIATATPVVAEATATPTVTPSSNPAEIDPTPAAAQEVTAALEATVAQEVTVALEAITTQEPAQAPTATPTAEAEVAPKMIAVPEATPTQAASSEHITMPTVTPVPALAQIEDTDPGPPFTIEISGNTATQDPLVEASQRYQITGLVRNDGEQTYAVSAIHVTFFDAQGFRGSFHKAPGRGQTGGEWVWHGQAEADFACLLLAPGEACPFSIEITAQNMASFLIHPDAVATERESIDVAVSNVQITQDSTDFVRITGTATNNSTVMVKNVTVVGALLDANGQMVSVGSVYVLQENIEPGASIDFDLRIEKETFAGYQLGAQAERDWE